MTNRVNTTMHRQQPPLGHPVTDHPPTHSSREQLGSAQGTAAMEGLQLGIRRSMRRGIFGPYAGLNFTVGGHVEVGGVRRTVGAGAVNEWLRNGRQSPLSPSWAA